MAVSNLVWRSAEICWNELEDFPRFEASSTPIGSGILKYSQLWQILPPQFLKSFQSEKKQTVCASKRKSHKHPKRTIKTRWWFQILFHFLPLLVEMIQFDYYFFNCVGSTTNQQKYKLESLGKFPLVHW